MMLNLATYIATAAMLNSPVLLSAFVPTSGSRVRITAANHALHSTSSDDFPPSRVTPYSQQEIDGETFVDESSRSSESDAYVGGAARSSEFGSLEPLPDNLTRRLRLESERRANSLYVSGGTDEFWDLRDEIAQLSSDLKAALRVGVSKTAETAVKRMLRRAQAKDPGHVFKVTSEAASAAKRLGRDDEAHKYEKEAERAKKYMPQFNLEGLWVGKYGSGFEMINVTYSGDRLVAYKVTGDHNIPRGEVTFSADLAPTGDDLSLSPPSLDPIVLSDASAKKWGTRCLPRFPGQGHASESGHKNSQAMEGQLVVIGEGEYFSFAWIPLELQIFFGRPSPELTIKMLREGGAASLTAGTGTPVPSLDDDIRLHVDYAQRCMEVTSDVMLDDVNEGKKDPFSCIWQGNDSDVCYFE